MNSPPRGGATRHAFAEILLVFLAVGMTACADARSAPRFDASLQLEGSTQDLQVLGERVLAALTRGDQDGLERVRLSRAQHHDVIWPELPASAPEVNFPLDYAWQNIESRNRRSLDRIVPLYRGRSLGLRRVECRGEAASFETFVVLTDCWTVFDEGGSPRLYEAQIFEDVVVRGGGFKIFRYSDEEPRRYGDGAASPWNPEAGR